MKLSKKNANKGFTLVELIVVIVILAILAAILVPALLGYIDKAKKQQSVLNGKSVLTAAQAELSSAYAKGKQPGQINKTEVITVADVADVCSNASIIVGGSSTAGATSSNHKAFTVYGVKYQEGTKDAIYYVYDESTNSSTWDATEDDYNLLKDASGKGYSEIVIKTTP